MKTLDLLFVVHRYYPFCGGSEYNVQRLAEEAVRQGHNATVLAGEHQGDQNGVRVVGNYNIVFDEQFDLIFVHGSCPMQDIVLNLAPEITKHTPLYYALIQPSESAISLHGMKYATHIGCGTSFDWHHAEKHGYVFKTMPFIYGVPFTSIDDPDDGFKSRYGITTDEMVLSVGGFWPHKRMDELAKAFIEANRPNSTLVLMGYDTRYGQPPKQAHNIKCIVGATHEEIQNAMRAADLYVMNSDSEGFGLVLLEAMGAFTPWISRNIAGAYDMKRYGQVYSSYPELVQQLRDFTVNGQQLFAAKKYVTNFHSMEVSLQSVIGVL